MERTHTLVFRQRQDTTERESRTEDLAEKTEELIDRVIELPGKTKTAQAAEKEVVEEVVLPYTCHTDRTDCIQQPYSSHTVVRVCTARVGGRTAGRTAEQRCVGF